MKIRTVIKYDLADRKYYALQKKCLFFFWLDLYSHKSLEKVLKKQNKLLACDGVVLDKNSYMEQI